MAGKKDKCVVYDAFPTKGGAKSAASDLRSAGDRARVRKITPQAGGRLKWGVFVCGKRKRR